MSLLGIGVVIVDTESTTADIAARTGRRAASGVTAHRKPLSCRSSSWNIFKFIRSAYWSIRRRTYEFLCLRDIIILYGRQGRDLVGKGVQDCYTYSPKMDERFPITKRFESSPLKEIYLKFCIMLL